MYPDALLLTTLPSSSCFPRSLLSSSFLPSHFLVAVNEILTPLELQSIMVAGKVWQQERDAAGHIAFTVSNAGPPLIVSCLFYPGPQPMDWCYS